jgi:putative ABC transport system permease protein
MSVGGFMLKDYFLIPLKEMRRRKLRSFLTLIGIIIGITAVTSLITLGQGLENAISNQFQALGDDKLFITAKGNPLTAGLSIDAIKITEDDLETVRRTTGVKKATGMIYGTTGIEFNDVVRYYFVSGMPVDPEERALIGEAQSYNLAKGRFLQKGDKFKVVLGHTYTEFSTFEKEMELGDKVLIQNQEFKVIGFLEKIGSPPDDSNILMPLSTYSDLFNIGDELGFLIAQSQPGEDAEKVATSISKELRKSRGLSEGKEDLNVETPLQLASTFNIILDIVNIVLVGIAGISLFVGGVGIMNTMYTTVLQRTKEIGILKAVGARNSHIMLLFLVESGLYGFIGGLIGVSVGIVIAKLVEQVLFVFVGPAFLAIEIDFALVIGALLFSFLVGCLSGIAPARRASKLNPVDSLRYE